MFGIYHHAGFLLLLFSDHFSSAAVTARISLTAMTASSLTPPSLLSWTMLNRTKHHKPPKAPLIISQTSQRNSMMHHWGIYRAPSLHFSKTCKINCTPPTLEESGAHLLLMWDARSSPSAMIRTNRPARPGEAWLTSWREPCWKTQLLPTPCQRRFCRKRQQWVKKSTSLCRPSNLLPQKETWVLSLGFRPKLRI